MRLLLVGAFPHPHHQGSQIYFQEQAIALRDQGVDVTLLTYGPPADPGRERDRGRTAREAARARDGFDHRTSPRWIPPVSLRSGPSWPKPLADLGLALTLRDALASSAGHDAFDAILTHHAEATLAALLVRRSDRPPIVYCVHTLLGRELPAYLNGSKVSKKRWVGRVFADGQGSRGALSRSLGRIGDRIDRGLAARVDGWVALTQSSECVMKEAGSAPGRLIPPPLPDPATEPGGLDPRGAARRHGLEPDAFFLYSGNLDVYQELDLLEAAARRLRGTAGDPGRTRVRLIVATHQPLAAVRPGRSGEAGNAGAGEVGFIRVESAQEMLSLLAAARGSLVMRRAEGGFPIKIVNSLAVGTPVLAFRGREWGLEHERNALVCAPDDPASTLARAIERLARDDALAKRLSAGARALYLERHRPEVIAPATLDHLEAVLSTSRSDR
ncbi:MAG TPA: glycosyltransferase [Deltaproteobacteria bacterium]|nr:glycosyltransferase [Deltaproteobacteria bacterium]